MPTPAVLFAWVLFGAIGLAAFMYGKKQAKLTPMLLGLALIATPYVIANTLLLYATGAALCVAMYWFRD